MKPLFAVVTLKKLKITKMFMYFKMKITKSIYDIVSISLKTYLNENYILNYVFKLIYFIVTSTKYTIEISSIDCHI